MSDSLASGSDDVHPSPNIQTDPDLYEIENLAADQDGLVERAI